VSVAIDEIEETELHGFIEWIQYFPAKRSRVFPPPNIVDYEKLWPASFLRISDLSRALLLFSRLLSPHTELINRFIELTERYERAFLLGDLDAALDYLKQIETDLGLSLWLIQARIAYAHEQRITGLEDRPQ
jgi:hypothetical protein